MELREVSLNKVVETKRDDVLPKVERRTCRKLDQYATKNVLVISLCFFLLFLAYDGLQFLQSSLHTEEGLGLATVSVMHAAISAATLFGVAPAIINKIGHKWTMVACMMAYLLWMLMNGHASWYTMIPSALLLGMGAAPLWVAAAAYLTITATNIASQSGGDMNVIIHRYFGVFFFTYSIGKSCFFRRKTCTVNPLE